MSESRGTAHPKRWLFAASSLFLVYACGGTVVERGSSGGGGSGGADTGGTGLAGGTSVGGAASGGKVGSGGRVGTGGKVGGGTGGKLGTGGFGTGGTLSTGGRVGSGGGTAGCPPGYLSCGGVCVDPQSNPSHCGYCFNGCSSDAKCVSGSCQTPPPVCAPNTTYCSNFGQCLDVNTNPFACGSCYSPCANGERCSGGTCQTGTCISNTATYCKTSGRCVELSTDYSNCGACDNQCGPADSCSNGKCIPPDCGSSTYCQSSGCTDTTTDIANCGGCGKSCTQGSMFSYDAYSCKGGACGCSPTANVCGSGCATNFWYCPPPVFSGSLADYCTQTARNGYERCACTSCLKQVQACFGSKSCVNAMDCSLGSACPSCQPVFSSCGDQNGATDPLADALLACINTQCAKP
jgi:hypothetical protein